MDPLSLFLVPRHHWVAQTRNNQHPPTPLPSPLFLKWAVPNSNHSTSWLHYLNPSLSVPPALLPLLSPTPPARPPRFPTALIVLQSTFQTATKAVSRKHRSNGCTPSNHGQLQYSSNYQWRERGMQKNTPIEHTLRLPPPFPFCCEWARKKGSGENRCGEYAKGQEPTFHSHISFWVYLAHLYFGS